ncbi:hypothetical protein ECSTECMHI813_0914 [Escherichia coli STEC_MHI813]|nr:hypothetical protein ECSTECMHI813_0914 [Escherichia coli STEC_MHI813]
MNPAINPTYYPQASFASFWYLPLFTRLNMRFTASLPPDNCSTIRHQQPFHFENNIDNPLHILYTEIITLYLENIEKMNLESYNS